MLLNMAGFLSFNDILYVLSGKFQGSPNNNRGRYKKQEAESGALVPVKV